MRPKSDLRRSAGIAATALLLFAGAGALAQQPAPPVVQLWPDGAPGSERRHGEAETVKDSAYYSNIHDPSLTVLRADPRHANGAAVIVIPGGGHRMLVYINEGLAAAKNLNRIGVTAFVLKYRLARDEGSGYTIEGHAASDLRRAVRWVRAHAADYGIDPQRIGIMGFSAGGELAAPAALFFEDFAKKNAGDALGKISPRPDFVSLVYPGPTPFTKAPETAIPGNVPPSFIVCAGAGDQVHAVWANEFFTPMLKASVPNVEMHIYGRGGHGGNITPRGGIPFGTWQDRFIDWFRDLGFLQKPGVETKAARDAAAHAAERRAPLRGRQTLSRPGRFANFLARCYFLSTF